MKSRKLISALSTLFILASCTSPEQNPPKFIDLRYTASEAYEISSHSPDPISFVVKSNTQWVIYSHNPSWCTINPSEGGPDEKYTVDVQYGDNGELDDRVDTLFIKSDYWIGMEITVTQAGNAYLYIDTEALSFPKEESVLEFKVFSNQNWSVDVSDSWLSIEGESTGEMDGTVKVKVEKNTDDVRAGTVTVYDRHGVKTSTVKVSQNGPKATLSFGELPAGGNTFIRTGETKIFPVVTNTTWCPSCDDPSVILNKLSDSELEVTLGPSPSLKPKREPTLKITSEDKTVTDALKINQERIWTVNGCKIDDATGTSTIVADGNTIHLVTRDPMAFRKVVFHVSNVNLPVNSVMRLLCYNSHPASGCDAQFAWWLGTGYRGGSTTDQKLPYLDIRGAYPEVSPFVKGKYSFEGVTQDMIDNLETIELSWEDKDGNPSLCNFNIALNGAHIYSFELGNLWTAGFTGLLTIGFYGEYAIENSSITINSIDIVTR